MSNFVTLDVNSTVSGVIVVGRGCPSTRRLFAPSYVEVEKKLDIERNRGAEIGKKWRIWRTTEGVYYEIKE